MKQFFFWVLALSLFCSCQPKKQLPNEFSLHLFQEPGHLDPSIRSGSSANYFFYNTLRGIYRIDAKKGLVPEGGLCNWKDDLTLDCVIEGQAWSDGKLVTPEDYARSFRHLVDPKTGSPRSYLLDNLLNAKKIMDGSLPPEELGVEIVDSSRFEVKFEKRDSEFLYKLASTALYPRHRSHKKDKSGFKNFVANGPYMIESWDFGKEMTLAPNPFYHKGTTSRPKVKFYFIDDEMTAYRLYQRNKLAFLRRIPSKMIDQVSKRKDFYQVPVARFDYLGFGPKMAHQTNLKKALATSIDYKKLKGLLHALGRPGCPSIPHTWVDKVPCFDFDLKKSKEAFQRVSLSRRNRTYNLHVSQMGGGDIKKQAEFYANQWKKHLGIKTRIKQVENKVYISQLRNRPPDIFRKGVGLDRPTCLNALETFSKDNKRNFIQLDSNDYQQILEKMALSKNHEEYRKLCQEGLEFLIDRVLVIPMGEIHFSILASPRFKGWTLNSLNQLDLSQLQLIRSTSVKQ